jgi:hypothetical protein
MRTHYGPCQPCWISNQHQKPKSGRGPSSEHFWQVWLISVQRFQRRRFKCEKLTDGRTFTYDKSSHGLWPGELKKNVIRFYDYSIMGGFLLGGGLMSCSHINRNNNGYDNCCRLEYITTCNIYLLTLWHGWFTIEWDSWCFMIKVWHFFFSQEKCDTLCFGCGWPISLNWWAELKFLSKIKSCH